MNLLLISLLITIASSENSSTQIQPAATTIRSTTLPTWEASSCWKKINLEEYPFLASIYSKCNGSSTATLINSGVIISDDYVLGLLWNPNSTCNYTVRVGENPWGYQGSRHEAHVILHENHTLRVGRTNNSNALVLYKLNNTISFGPRAQPIEISENETTSGSGSNDAILLNALVPDNVLTYMILNNAMLNTNITVLSEERCKKLLENWSGPMAQNYSHPPLEGTFCTIHVRDPDPCEEVDSFINSALVMNGKLVGLLADYMNGSSISESENDQNENTSTTEPILLYDKSSVVSIYLNVSVYREWITNPGPLIYNLNKPESSDDNQNGFKISNLSPLKELRKFFDRCCGDVFTKLVSIMNLQEH